ncbi:lipoate--protein ligase [Natronincola ferrireducens]|uniref:lipoate--protein ligase n=1 Tax=Natronincola ferrireducens TaxID=393762 RepID=A0A1G8Y3L9_9FIRM|nr:lipoate--protein ligase [Natronincola ferrireducens]SDJ97469.1 lipoate-protein ligase [Natronincola ferrireducens]
MISIKNNSNDPHFNLALEEYALKYLNPEENYVILWQNEPSVIIGRNQNTIEEINTTYVKEKGINVVRRLSGGGAVYHDFGNLNFTFIVTIKDEGDVNNFKKFTEPVIKALAKFGIEAELSGRNDITIDGKKFSGNAQYFYKNRLLHHGTILFDSNLGVVQETLNVKQEKIESKGVKSVKSRVTNIHPYLKEKITVDAFKEALLNYLLEGEEDKKQYTLTKEDLRKIKELMEERYLKWGWNYGESPKYSIQKNKRFIWGGLDLRLEVKSGIIQDCVIYGDFFGHHEISTLTEKLKGIQYREEEVAEALKNIDLSPYFKGIEEGDFLACMFS